MSAPLMYAGLFALLLIVSLAWDNRHYGHVWSAKED